MTDVVFCYVAIYTLCWHTWHKEWHTRRTWWLCG